MKTKLVLVLSALLISGCEVSSLDKARAEYACRERGGVYSIHLNNSVRCNDGSYNRLPTVITKDYWVKKESNDEQLD